MLLGFVLNMQRESKITQAIFCDNFGKRGPIFNNFSPLHSEMIAEDAGIKAATSNLRNYLCTVKVIRFRRIQSRLFAVSIYHESHVVEVSVTLG